MLNRSIFTGLLCLLTLAPFIADADEIRIGTTLSLTGAYSTYGNQALHGIELAIEEANATGGIHGKRVKLFVEDIGTLDLKQAVTAARKMISSDGVSVFLPLIIEDSEVIVPITSKIPMLTMAVGCGARKCGISVGKFHVRAAASHDAIVERLVIHTKERGARHACVLAAEATYFEGYGKYIAELTSKAGLKVTYVSVPFSNSEDYREIATRFNQEKCDSIFPWIPMGSFGAFLRRVRESGSKAQIYGIVEADDPGILKTAGAAAEGVIFARFSVGSKEFQKRFQDRFGEPVSRPAIPAYDGVKLLLDLIRKVGTDAKALRDEFSQVSGIPATNGTLSYSKDGERAGENVELMEIRNGRATEVAATAG